jgi:hypothetical protein
MMSKRKLSDALIERQNLENLIGDMGVELAIRATDEAAEMWRSLEQLNGTLNLSGPVMRQYESAEHLAFAKLYELIWNQLADAWAGCQVTEEQKSRLVTFCKDKAEQSLAEMNEWLLSE